MRFNKLADILLNEYFVNKKSPMNKIILNELINLIGDTPIKQIDHNTYDLLLKAWKNKGNSASTINRKLKTLGSCLTYAADRGLISTRPKFKLLVEEPEQLTFVTPEQETQLLKCFTLTPQEEKTLSKEKQITKILMKAIIIIGLDTGMRMSELLRINDDSIDGNYIRVWENKNNTPRSIPMTKRVNNQIQIIKQYEYFDLLNKSKVSYQFNDTTVKELGFKHITFHSLRHTFASRLLQNGVPIYKVSKLLGHKSVVITDKIYGHLRNKDLEDAIATIDKYTE